MMGAPYRPPKHTASLSEAWEGGAGNPHLRPTNGGSGGIRKKGAWVRPWLLVDSAGQAKVVGTGKHAITQRTGLPARDLRILDPALSHPSTILGRERAIVVNLEHIKAIITTQEVMFLNWRDPLVTPFVEKLQQIFCQHQAIKSPQEARVDANIGQWENLYNSDEQQSITVSPRQSCTGGFPNNNKEGNADGEQKVTKNANGVKLLPFEFVALEASLEAACSALDSEARRLEQESYPALDKLTSMISTLNLECVRQIKSRLVDVTGRVQKVRDEIEHLLDDDGDMAEMYLTDKFKQQQQLEHSSASSVNELDSTNEQVAITKHLNVKELEMILEAYFVQIDGTLNKLSALREYVDNTEDHINIMLDDKQNHLLQTGVVLSTATAVVSAFVALTGVFGMNITIELFDSEKAGMPQFLWTVGGGAAGCLFFYVAAIAWYKHKRLLA